MPDVIFVPFPKSLYDDLVRFSDGALDPAAEAEWQLRAWIDMNLTADMTEGFRDVFEPRLAELAEKYAPHVAARWRGDESPTPSMPRPLVWKEVVISSGSAVRMTYGGSQHYAVVQDGAIVDEGQRFTPSEWASKVASGTSRNAWRDLWIKMPGASSVWTPATVLREQMRAALGIGEVDHDEA